MQESEAGVQRARAGFEVLDAILAARLPPRTSWGERLAGSLSWRTSRFDRVAHLTRALDALAPWLVGRVLAFLLRGERPPLLRRELEPFAYGARTVVYRVVGGSHVVLKAYRIATGRSLAEMQAVAQLVDSAYRTVLAWYGADSGLIPATLVFVGRGPVRGVRTALTLQRTVRGDASDLLLDHEDGQLIALAATDSLFATALERFLDATLRTWRREQRCVDFLGAGKVLLVREPGGASIQIVDFGTLEFEELRRTAPLMHERALRGLTRLDRLRAAQRKMRARRGA